MREFLGGPFDGLRTKLKLPRCWFHLDPLQPPTRLWARYDQRADGNYAHTGTFGQRPFELGPGPAVPKGLLVVSAAAIPQPHKFFDPVRAVWVLVKQWEVVEVD